MESVIGSKKYFKSLGPGAESDYYRHRTGFPTNYSASAYNTLGRCSTGPYVHLNNFPLHVDVGEMGNPYRYNGWGMMNNDAGSRKLAPSVSYSSSGEMPRKNRVKSFTILLLTAAFIVMVAVLSVAGLAFYFSTFKSEYSETMMVFEGEFMVVRGDVFTTGLKYNHTTTFDQKSQMYEKIITNGVTRGGLVVMHCEVIGFGDGPLINVLFRLFLDIRKIPTSINSVEDHIVESIINEFSVPNTLNSIKIDHHSVQVKRIIKTDQISSAYFVKQQQQAITSHSASFGSRPTIETVTAGTPFSSLRQPSSSFASKHETPEIKEAPAAGIARGSFEVTKTDADITQKKSSSPQFQGAPTTTLRPFNITNIGGAIKIKTKKITIEKVTIPTKAPGSDSNVVTTSEPLRKIGNSLAVTVTRPKSAQTTTARTSTTTTTMEPTTTKIVILTTTTAQAKTTSSSTSSSSTTTNAPLSTTESNAQSSITPLLKPTQAHNINLPQLNEHLFTHAPILDNKPWLPIDPTISANANPPNTDTHRASAEPSVPRTTTAPNRIYHSFSNPAFVATHQSIEPLGINAVRPYPIPVDKIHASNIEPVLAGRPTQSFGTVADHGNYEHLGDGIMVKKSEGKVRDKVAHLPEVTITSQVNVTVGEYASSTVPAAVSIPAEVVEIKIENRETDDDNLPDVPVAPKNASKPLSPDPTSWDQPLYPMNLRPGSNDNSHKPPLRKVYNDTLQAWIVENDQIENKPNTLAPPLPPPKSNIQNISVIFDTLASKLGITPKVADKVSPIHKTKPSAPTIVTTHATPTVMTNAPTSTSTEILYGEAEIEEVDPTQYEEILRRDRAPTTNDATTDVAPTLITLMPVRSNSGLRLRHLRDAATNERFERKLPATLGTIGQIEF